MTETQAAQSSATATGSALRNDARAIFSGLSSRHKTLSPKYFYDEAGSKLFDQICELPEYYLTRTEREIMERHLPEMASLIGPGASIIEFGSGSSDKIRLLLDHLVEPAAYVPVDISGDYLAIMANELARDYPDLQVRPVVADFTRPFDLPVHPITPARNLVYFPGSTIGNFARKEALELLDVMRIEARPGGALLIGVDLKKDPLTLQAAYNDSAGITAQFNLNVLRRLNRELGADFELEAFRHEAIYDERNGRIEMRLVSDKAQSVRLPDGEIEFREGEYIITEYSHKYGLEEFRELGRSAGFNPERSWQDDEGLFSVNYLTVPR